MKVLSTLTEAGPHEAPERVEIALKEAFRRHHSARRVRRAMIAAIATAAVAAGIAMVVRMPAPIGRPEPIAWYPVPPAIASIKSSPAVQHAPAHKPTYRPRSNQLATTEFVALPYGDDSLVKESATIVRVELPRSALRLAGFSVAQERANDPPESALGDPAFLARIIEIGQVAAERAARDFAQPTRAEFINIAYGVE